MKQILSIICLFFAISATNAQVLTKEQLFRSALMKDATGNLALSAKSATAVARYPNIEKLTENQIWGLLFQKNLDGTYSLNVAGLSGGGGSSSSPTNLSLGAITSTTAQILSSTGAGVVLPISTASFAGLQSAQDKANQDAAITLSGVAAGAANNGLFSGVTIPDNSTTKAALQALETATETKQATLLSGTNIKTINGISLLGSGDVVIGGSGTTTNSFLSQAESFTSVVNGVSASFTPSDGTIAKTLGFNAAGDLVKQTPAQSNQTLVASSGGADIEYSILTGTPSVSYSKSGGVGTMTVTGGTIKLLRFADIVLDAERDGSNNFKWNLVGTGVVQKLAIPKSSTKHTLNLSDATADASSDATISNQLDIDNTPAVKYGNIVVSGQGSITIRSNVIPTSGSGAGNGYDFAW
ncbi:MAG: hypothetical protein U5L45_00275 [Saprospiraceae bacterium]|nr:hypothetical protein [Saprospiraceae bacterium]